MKTTKSAAGVVINKSGEVLLVKQQPGTWSLPKGYIMRSEEALDAARRHIYEETGINRLEFIKVLGHYTRYKVGPKGGDDASEYKTIFTFLLTTDQEKAKPLAEHIMEAEWFPLDQVESTLTHFKDKQFFERIKERIIQSIEKERRFPSPKRVIVFHYTLYDQQGHIVESSSKNQPAHYLEGSSQLVPGLSRFLLKMKKADSCKVTVRAYEAYGYRDEELVNRIPLTRIPVKIELGDVFEVESDDGGLCKMTAIFKDLNDVILDGNHPLAGQDVVFDIEIVDVREANPEELLQSPPSG